MESTGIKAFDKAAIRMVERSTCEPARLGDRAIDSGTVLKVIFTMDAPALIRAAEFVAATTESSWTGAQSGGSRGRRMRASRSSM